MEPETLAALAALVAGLGGASAAYAYARNATRKLDVARARIQAKAKSGRYPPVKVVSTGAVYYYNHVHRAKKAKANVPPQRAK